MNCACCCPQVPPPARLNGAASGVKKTPVRFTPEPPFMENLLLEAVDQNDRVANGPSVGASQVGGVPVLTLAYPETWTIAVWRATSWPPVRFQSPLRTNTNDASALDAARQGVTTTGSRHEE